MASTVGAITLGVILVVCIPWMIALHRRDAREQASNGPTHPFLPRKDQGRKS